MKKLIILTILLIAVIVSYLIIFRNEKEQLTNNNSEIKQSQAISTKELSAPKSQKLIVPEELKNGPFQNDRVLFLPEEYEIRVFAAGLSAPRALAITPENDIYVSDKGTGKIWYIKDSNNDQEADVILEVLTGLRNIHGITYYKGDLYLAEEDQISVLYGLKKDKYVRREILVSQLPADGGHNTRTIKIGPDEKIYLSIGSSCNICEENDPRRASIVRYNLDGSGEEIFATGLRNTVDFIFDEDNKMWGVDNGRDNLGDNKPSEEVNIIQYGRNYGWPYCYGDKIANPEYVEKQEFCTSSTTAPTYNLQAHSAPLGLTFGPEGSLENNLFVSFHGSWNRTVPTGYKVIRIDTKNIDYAPLDFIYGWLQPNDTAWGRPVDIKIYKDSMFLITDDKAGALYIVNSK